MKEGEERRWRRIAPRLRVISYHDPHIHMLVRLYMTGDIPDYESFLEQATFALADGKQQIMAAALRERQLSTTI